MIFNKYGEYVAEDIRGVCSDECNLCLMVCPFSEQVEDEDSLGLEWYDDVSGIKHRKEVGYYLGAYVGYSKVDGHRENGASGGWATWVLESLLLKKIVDKVICVSPLVDRNVHFQFVICSTPEEVRSCSKSCYYPVEISSMVRRIASSDSRYAIIGLPCLIKALRLAMKRFPKLKKRIKYLLSLTCGYGKSKFFTEYVCALGGGQVDHVDKVTFRIKSVSHKPKHHGMEFVCDSGSGDEKKGMVFWSEGPGDMWTAQCFTPIGCNFCEDTFAELADITFMDAWLPEYRTEHRGTSLAVVRAPIFSELIEKGRDEGQLVAKEVSIGQVIRSQYDIVRRKRGLIVEISRIAKQSGQKTPKIRTPIYTDISFGEKLVAKARWSMCLGSRKQWCACSKDVVQFLRLLRPCVMRLRFAFLVLKAFQHPLKAPAGLARWLMRYFLKALKLPGSAR